MMRRLPRIPPPPAATPRQQPARSQGRPRPPVHACGRRRRPTWRAWNARRRSRLAPPATCAQPPPPLHTPQPAPLGLLAFGMTTFFLMGVDALWSGKVRPHARLPCAPCAMRQLASSQRAAAHAAAAAVARGLPLPAVACADGMCCQAAHCPSRPLLTRMRSLPTGLCRRSHGLRVCLRRLCPDGRRRA